MAKHFSGLIACVVGAFLVLLTPAAGQAAGAEGDLSSPAKALSAFSRALEKGDWAELKAVVAGDEKQQEWVRAEAAQWAALRELEAALAKRFGANYASADKGKEAKERIAEAKDDDLHADLQRAKLGEAKPDEVEVVLDESAPSNRQGRLVRVEGRWKMDLASLSEYMAPDDVPVLKAVGAAAADLARDVGAGKFPTLDEAADALDERLTAAVDGAMPKTKPQEPAGKKSEKVTR